ncbi:MAG TPA: hypothetical protein VF487_14635 [Chitinophagaceae bacterium]
MNPAALLLASLLRRTLHRSVILLGILEVSFLLLNYLQFELLVSGNTNSGVTISDAIKGS